MLYFAIGIILSLLIGWYFGLHGVIVLSGFYIGLLGGVFIERLLGK